MRTQSFFVASTLIGICFTGIDDFSCLFQVKAQDRPNAEAAIPTATGKASDATHEFLVTGVVLKPDGSPAAGAVLRSAVPVTTAMETRLGRKIVPRMHETTAVADGRFTIAISRSPYDELPSSEITWQTLWKTTPIVALLGGFGPAHVEIDEIDEGEPVTMKLVDDLPIRGQIIDLEGQPVRGTRVTIAEVQMMKGDDPSRLLMGLNGNGGSQVFILAPHFQRQWGLQLVERRLIDLPEHVVTDENGGFEIRGLGKDRVLHFTLDGGDVAWRTVTAISRELEPIQPGTVMRQRIPELIYGSKFKVTTPPSRPVEGIVVDAQTEKPLAGVLVEMERPRSSSLGRQMAMHTGRPLTVMKTVTDETGHFRLMGMAKTDGNSLLVFPPADQPYFHEEINVGDAPGIDPINLKIKLHRGIWINGRITDKETKKPVVGALVHYSPFGKNDFAADISIYKRPRLMEADLDRFKTAADGSYRLVGMPGAGIVTAMSGFQRYRTGVGRDQLTMGKDDRNNQPFVGSPMSPRGLREINALKEINPSVDEQEFRVNLEFESGTSITVLLVDSEGVPVKDVRAWGQGVRPPANSSENLHDGVITVENLAPDDKPVLHAYHFDRNLGLKFQLEPPYDKGREFKFVLEPMAKVTGRLFEDGAPMRRVPIGRHYREPDHGVSLTMPPAITTDQEGRFRCPLIPGHEYQLVAQGRPFKPMTFITEKLDVKAGETIDVGDLKFEDDRFRPVKTEQLPEKPNAGNEPK